MALPRPLRLRSETIRPKAEQSSSLLPIARCWVDSGVFHLDQSFDYLVPDNLDSRLSIGARVEVPFHGREVEAIVLSRQSVSEVPVLRPITKIISTQSVATRQTIDLIEAVSRRWACHPFDVIRSAIPPRVASIEKKQWIEPLISKNKPDHKKIYLQTPAHIDRYRFISDSVKSRSSTGSMLIVVPDTRSISHLHQFFPEAIVLDSALGRSERYENFLRCRYGQNQIVIGTRSAIFAPIADLQTIVVVDEGSESHYEIRTPGWNVRDVALLRASIEGVALAFIGYSPSAEIARLIDISQISYIAKRNQIDVRAYSQSNGELIPSRLIKDIRTAAHKGPILFLALRKGYSQAIACAQCKNIAYCACGGKLRRLTASSAPECSICSKSYQDWRCSWCHSTTPFLMARGSERFAYEIGRAFPGEMILQSTGEKMIDRLEEEHAFVITTAGAAPIAKNGYSLVVILEADRFLMQADLRAHERGRDIFFATTALLRSGGIAALVCAGDNPMIGALSSWKPSLVSQRELRDRLEADMPPFVRAVTLDINTSEAQGLLRALKKAQEDGRIPQSTRFLGPSHLKDDIDRIVALTQLDDGEDFISLLHEFQRRRSSSKKSLASIRIDPYSLSR